MKFETKYKLLMQKRYFDVGYGWTSQIKYLLIAIGLTSKSSKFVIIVGSIYFVICYFLGYYLHKCNWIEAQTETSNRWNKLSKELRHDMKKKKV